MDWVKLGSSYFLDVAIACLDDAGEVMFLRGLAYCGASESGGFIPAAALPALGRRNQAKTADALVVAGKWEQVLGGYQVVQWQKWQSELEALIGRRKKEAARKRRARAAGQSAPEPLDVSADAGADNGGTESRGEEETTTQPVVVRSTSPTRRTRVTADWRPSSGAWLWAAGQFPGHDLERELEQFRDYHTGKGNVMASWDAAWRTWMRNTQTFQPSRSTPPAVADAMEPARRRALAAMGDPA